MERSASWPDDRAELHRLQREPPSSAEPALAELSAKDVLARLTECAAVGYSAAFPDAGLVTFAAAGISFLFEHSTSAQRAIRSAWHRRMSRRRTGIACDMTIPDPTADDEHNEPSSDPKHSRETVLNEDHDRAPEADRPDEGRQEPPD